MRDYRDPYDRGRGSAYYLPPRRSQGSGQAPRRRSVSRYPRLYTDGYDADRYGAYPRRAVRGGPEYDRRRRQVPAGTGEHRGRGYAGGGRSDRGDNYPQRVSSQAEGYARRDTRGGRYRDDPYYEYDEYDEYEDYPPERSGGKRRVGTIILLTLVLLVIAAVNVSIYLVSSTLKKIDVRKPETVAQEVFDVSAADVMGSLPEDGTSGEQLNSYHAAVYRRDILNAYYSENELAHSQSATNILVMSGETERSPYDIILLISINKGQRKVTFTSVMPETGIAYAQVDAPMRLSCASVMGGAQLTVSTVQSLLGIRIDKYILLDSEGMEAFIDATGSVLAKLSEEQSDAVNAYIVSGGDTGTQVLPGSAYLSGRQLVMLARYAGVSDGGMISKRRGELLFDVACNLNDCSPTKLIKAVYLAAPYCHTDITGGQLFTMSSMIYELRGYDVMTDTVPAEGEYTLVSAGGRTMMRVADIDSCRDRIVRGALGIEPPAHTVPEALSDSDAFTDIVTGSDIPEPPEG